MFIDGAILHFSPFEFANGDKENKFFLVIKNIGDVTILASLPSSQRHLPEFHFDKIGCINDVESCVSCFVIEENIPICDNGFSFSKRTYLHGHWVDEFNVAVLKEKYQIEGIEYQTKGVLNQNYLNQIINCFKSASTVKAKIKRKLI